MYVTKSSGIDRRAHAPTARFSSFHSPKVNPQTSAPARLVTTLATRSLHGLSNLPPVCTNMRRTRIVFSARSSSGSACVSAIVSTRTVRISCSVMAAFVSAAVDASVSTYGEEGSDLGADGSSSELKRNAALRRIWMFGSASPCQLGFA